MYLSRWWGQGVVCVNATFGTEVRGGSRNFGLREALTRFLKKKSAVVSEILMKSSELSEPEEKLKYM